MVEACHYGVFMPGGAETLVHTREAIENAIRSEPSCGVWATVDVDFQNAFPSLVYEAVDSAVGTNPRAPTVDEMVLRQLRDHLPAIG